MLYEVITLTTGMVGEFPELQGVMGRYYALADGEPPEVAEAIAEHYAPLGPNDRCPNAPVSVAVALADKIDTLVGFWAIGEPPTGSKDPRITSYNVCYTKLLRLRPKGWATFVHRADRLDELLAGLRGRAGGIVVFPLWPKAGQAARRVLVRARKGTRAPLTLAAGLVLHSYNFV